MFQVSSKGEGDLERVVHSMVLSWVSHGEFSSHHMGSSDQRSTGEGNLSG